MNTCSWATGVRRCSTPAPGIAIKHCASNKIDVAALYPGCKTLFHGLLGGDGNDWVLGEIAETIKASWLIDISRLLIKISMELRDATSSRSCWIPAFRNKSHFPRPNDPTTEGSGDLRRAVSPEDSTWFIADQAGFDDAFRVKMLKLSGRSLQALSPVQPSVGPGSVTAAAENTFPVKLTLLTSRYNFFRSRVLFDQAVSDLGEPLANEDPKVG